MAVEKTITNVPFPTNPDEIELIIDDKPEDMGDTTVMLEDGGAIINYQESSQLGGEFDSNLAEDLPDEYLRELASDYSFISRRFSKSSRLVRYLYRGFRSFRSKN